LHQVYATFEDITERELLAREVKRQATTDFLTGAPNRRSFMSRLTLEFDRVKRKPALQCGLLGLDLDHFKRVNDTWGHAAGDQILADVAARLTEVAGGAALVARWGGEEFLVLLPDADEDEGGRVGERLRAALAARPLRPAPGADPVTVSVGVAGIGAHETLSAAIDRADRAMYRSKSGGRDAVSVASAPMAVSP
jgi:diguanylate cyclase (GGDEF)-like protein